MQDTADKSISFPLRMLGSQKKTLQEKAKKARISANAYVLKKLFGKIPFRKYKTGSKEQKLKNI